jgi:hypothetical protein
MGHNGTGDIGAAQVYAEIVHNRPPDCWYPTPILLKKPPFVNENLTV